MKKSWINQEHWHSLSLRIYIDFEIPNCNSGDSDSDFKGEIFETLESVMQRLAGDYIMET